MQEKQKEKILEKIEDDNYSKNKIFRKKQHSEFLLCCFFKVVRVESLLE